MGENHKYVIISSYEDEVKYFNDVIDSKENRCPIFVGNGESGKSRFSKMIENGDIDETKIKSLFSFFITKQ
jgi:hypothetical protein